jgi:hypothetical protein
MKNLIKIMFIGITALSYSFSVAQAGELTVTGSVKASMATASTDGSGAGTSQNKAIGISNEFSLGASGELDNGWTWTYQQDIDGATVQDDAQLKIATGFGTLGIFVSEGGLDADNAASQSVVGRPSDTSYSEGMFDSFDLGSMNTLQYHTPAGLIPFATVVKVAYAPSTKAAINSHLASGTINTAGFTASTGAGTSIAQGSNMGEKAEHWRIDAVPVDGMKIGADYVNYGTVNGATGQDPESGSAYITYAYGPATFGYSKNYTSFALASASADNLTESLTGRKYSVAFNVNDNLSVSYENERSTPESQTAATVDYSIKAVGYQAAYTMGGMTLAIARNSFENVSYIQNKDVQDTVLSVAMAF